MIFTASRHSALAALAVLACLASGARAESNLSATTMAPEPAAAVATPAPAEASRLPSPAVPEAPPEPVVSPAAVAAMNAEPPAPPLPAPRERLVDDLVYGVAIGAAVGVALSLEHTLGRHSRGTYIGVGAGLGLVGGWIRHGWRLRHAAAAP